MHILGFRLTKPVSWNALLLAILLIACVSCARKPQQAAKFLARGEAHMQQKEYSEAVLDLKNAVQLQPKNAEGFYQLGLAYLGSGNLRGAYSSLAHAAELNPKNTQAQLKLAEMLSSARDANQSVLEDAEERGGTL